MSERITVDLDIALLVYGHLTSHYRVTNFEEIVAVAQELTLLLKEKP